MQTISEFKTFLSECTQLSAYPKLYFKVRENYVEEAIAFSKKLYPIAPEGYTRTLEQCFESLNRMANNCSEVCVLYEDFVKHSFYFIFYDDFTFQRGMNGGVILHGYEETFSVEIDADSKAHWSIHT